MDRYKSARLVSILGIVGNIFLLIIKFQDEGLEHFTRLRSFYQIVKVV